ncbi:TOPRIM nucleotidyl transferase/hydrolase domain-containing protein [Mycoplasma sp. E35C]|uniref:TOPRIM nucleotidyl transferase/hydrolase domain-containing protein n=1 Tax=Mycoplasma sp. E35C TaxID=2801918 RepID=UPI001CA3CF13|nr:TOPRIM nucleotidyl transferase/hydrolase domain-containing protein [Mycoplasma sp. E35C]QZX49400.1 hypothetical protein JJE79_01480 [Mycoplasma sp. E35C]
MKLEIIIGKNKTGKTFYLKNKYPDEKAKTTTKRATKAKGDDASEVNNDIQETKKKVLYIPAEIDYESIYKKGALEGGKNAPLSPQAKMIEFLKDQVTFQGELQLKEDEKQKIISMAKSLEIFKEKLEYLTEEDCYLEKMVNEMIHLNDYEKIQQQFSLLSDAKVDKIEGSSGSMNYSLLRIIKELLSDDTIPLNKDWILVIDEIEKFCHPELIYKIAHLVFEVAKQIDVVITTHSPIFLERIFYLHKNYLFSENNDQLEISYKIMKPYWIEEIKKAKQDSKPEVNILNSESEPWIELGFTKSFLDMIVSWNYKELSDVAKILFSDKVFLVEGINDNDFINSLILSQGFIDKYATIIICGSKTSVKKMYKRMSNLKINTICKFFVIFDKDNDGSSEKQVEELLKVDDKTNDDKQKQYQIKSWILEKIKKRVKSEEVVQLDKTNATPPKTHPFDRNIEEHFFEKESKTDEKFRVKKEDGGIELVDLKGKEIMFTVDYVKEKSTKSNVDALLEEVREKIEDFMKSEIKKITE